MKHFAFSKKSYRLRYPFGDNIENAIEYISLVCKQVRKIVNKDCTEIPINLWVCGASGVFLAGLFVKTIGKKFKVKIQVVRKPHEDAHHLGVCDVQHPAINIILDDFVRSGKTISKIYDQMKHRVEMVDLVIVANLLEDEIDLPFEFVPRAMISDSNSFRKEWLNLEPTKCVEKIEHDKRISEMIEESLKNM